MKSLISIMVPVYNAERYLERCLDSVLTQTYTNIEVILVNDGSKDCSGEICDRYAKQDNRIKVFHKANEGVAATRNVLLSKAKGDFLMFVDSDDTIPNDAVAVMYERMVQDGSDMVIGRHMVIEDEYGGRKKQFAKEIKNDVLHWKELLEMIELPGFVLRTPWGKLYRRELFDGIRFPNLKVGEDSWAYPHIVMKCRIISTMSKNVYYYHMNGASLTQTTSEQKWVDAIIADLHVVDVLMGIGLLTPAQRCFNTAVSYGLNMHDKQRARKLIEDSFTKHQLKLLMKGRGIKPYLKWLCLYVPGVYRAIRWVKTRLGYE